MVAVFPIVVFLIILLTFGVILSKVLLPRMLKGNRASMVFLAYVIVLAAVSLLSFILPPKEHFAGRAVSSGDIERQREFQNDYVRLIESGRIDEIKGAEVKEKWKIPLERNSMSIKSAISDFYMLTFVESVPGLEGEAAAYYYGSKSYIENVDISDRIPPPQLEAEGANIVIYPPAPLKLEFAKFSLPFPFSQFSDDGNIYFNHETVFFNHGFLYIQVPEGVKVDGNVMIIN